MKENIWTRGRSAMMAVIAGVVMVGNSAVFTPEAHAGEMEPMDAAAQAMPSDLDQMKAFELNAFRATITANGLSASLQEAIRCGHWAHHGEHRAFKEGMKRLHDANEALISDAENYAPSMAKHQDPRVSSLFKGASAQVDVLMDAEQKLSMGYKKLMSDLMRVPKGGEAYPADGAPCLK